MFFISNLWMSELIGLHYRIPHITNVHRHLLQVYIVRDVQEGTGTTATCSRDVNCATVVDRWVTLSDTLIVTTPGTCMECRRAVTITLPVAQRELYVLLVLTSTRCVLTMCIRPLDLSQLHIIVGYLFQLELEHFNGLKIFSWLIGTV